MWMDNFAFQPFWNKDVEALLHIFSWAVTFLSEFGLQRAERWVLPCISPFLFFVDIDKFRNMNSAFFHALHDERWCLTLGDVAPWVPRPVHIGSCCSSHLSWAQLPPTETMEEKPCLHLRRRQPEPASKITQKLSKFHGLVLLLLTEICWSKEVMTKSCKHRNRKALRGQRKLKKLREI